MTGRVGHSTPALAAAGIGAVAAFLAGAAGAPTLAVALAVLLLGYGRNRGWAISRQLERPRIFTIAGALYVGFFPLDMALSFRSGPVLPLVRLIVFLLAADVLGSNCERAHRPVLFGLLLMMATAAETTDVWFVLPLIAFSIAAVSAQIRSTLIASQPAGCAGDPLPPIRGALPVAIGSMLLGTALFFVIPRVGAGWGGRPASGEEPARLETGLSEEVSLDTVGRVKRRRTVAFRARVSGGRAGVTFDPESIYWRAQTYSGWNGAGWTREKDESPDMLALPAHQLVPVPGEDPGEEPALVAEIERVRMEAAALPIPGRPLWVRAAKNAVVITGKDGTLRGLPGSAPRAYEVAVRVIRSRPAKAGPGGGPPAARGSEEPPPATTETGQQDPEVEKWAAGVAPGALTAYDLARAFVADLAARPYSLDTSRIDPRRPIASFLGGAAGHCEYFASAMALGLRLRGVPARVVGGYLGADELPFGSDLIVRDSRAHLWVEAYLPQSGWATFDPTPEGGRFLSSGRWPVLRAAWDRSVLAWDSWIIGLDLGDQLDAFLVVRERAFRWASALARSGPRVGILIGALAALAAAVGFMVRRRRRRAKGEWLSGLPPFYRRLLRRAARRGARPSPVETAREFGLRAGRALGNAEAVGVVVHLYERARYGGRPLSGADLARAAAALRRLS